MLVLINHPVAAPNRAMHSTVSYNCNIAVEFVTTL